jgi:hypothetical protein
MHDRLIRLGCASVAAFVLMYLAYLWHLGIVIR